MVTRVFPMQFSVTAKRVMSLMETNRYFSRYNYEIQPIATNNELKPFYEY